MKIEERQKYILGSLYLAQKSAYELLAILKHYQNNDRFNIAKQEPMLFYASTLQYCMVNEYCKLSEDFKPNKPNKNVGSCEAILIENKEYFISKKGFDFNDWLLEVKKFKSLKISDLFRDKRNEELSHIDAKSKAMSIKGLSIEDIKSALEALETPRLLCNAITRF